MIRFCFLVYVIFGSVSLLAQDVARQQEIDHAAMDYLRTAYKQSTLYYGKQQERLQVASNHSYLIDEGYAKARLSYSHTVYPEAQLRWDLYRDELIVQSPDYRNIVLFPENVDFAELHDRNIIYFRRDSLSGCPSSGYYILLHSGNCKVLEKPTAALLNHGIYASSWLYMLTTNFYLYKDDVYYIIRNKRGLLTVLHPYKKELKRFISAHRLGFRDDAEKFLAMTVHEYERLSGAQ